MRSGLPGSSKKRQKRLFTRKCARSQSAPDNKMNWRELEPGARYRSDPGKTQHSGLRGRALALTKVRRRRSGHKTLTRTYEKKFFLSASQTMWKLKRYARVVARTLYGIFPQRVLGRPIIWYSDTNEVSQTRKKCRGSQHIQDARTTQPQRFGTRHWRQSLVW